MHMTPRLIPRVAIAAVTATLGWAVFIFGAAQSDETVIPDSAAVDSTAFVHPPGDAARGKKLFGAKGCVACHKADGSGGIKLGGNPTPDWRDAERMSDPAYNDAYLRDCITNGRPKSGMVPWKGTLKPAQIEDLIAYIHTFEKKKKK
jgi:mono/diheme cytochrome c family protein